MIYGPFSTGWRDECRRERRAAMLARIALGAVALASAGVWYVAVDVVAAWWR